MSFQHFYHKIFHLFACRQPLKTFVRVVFGLALGIVILGVTPYSTLAQRQWSPSTQLFERLKDGVVTVQSLGHGSGFVVDPLGLVITNHHVVNNTHDSDLRIRLNAKETLAAKVLVKDPLNDLAVVWINPKRVAKLATVPIFQPPLGQPLANVGERVLALGSPVEWETLEKTMTEGIVSKVDDRGAIRHDASINGGNSGGPLFNFDGQVIGVNSFGHSDRGPAIGGSIPITLAIPLLIRAQHMILSGQVTPPSEELLAIGPSESYPIEVLRKVVTTNNRIPALFLKRYELSALSYTIELSTPVKEYQMLLNQDAVDTYYRRRRLKRQGRHISSEELETGGMSNWLFLKPVVSITVQPTPQQTMGSLLGDLAVALAASDSTTESLAMLEDSPMQLAANRDFERMQLVNKTTRQPVCQHVGGGRTQVDAHAEGSNGERLVQINDKFFIGRYEYDPQCFNRPEALTLLVWGEGDKSPKKYDIPTALKNRIVADFSPYWAYMAAKPLHQLQAGHPSFTPSPVATPFTPTVPVFTPTIGP